MTSISGVELPAGTHVTVLTGRDIVTGGQLANTVVWADRSYAACPRCRETIPIVVEHCPVLLNVGACSGGAIEARDLQHGCGQWLSVGWAALDNDAAAEDVLAVAEELATRRATDLTAARDHLRARLRAELANVLAADLVTGSETEPGVYCDGGTWLAWDYDPDGSGDPITVSAADGIR